MSTDTLELTVQIPNESLEQLVRRIVREELLRLVERELPISENWQHEGEVDMAGDEMLLAEALAVLEEFADQPDAWTDWADFEAKLDRAEVEGELSN